MVVLHDTVVFLLFLYSVSSADEHRFSLDGRSKQFLTINVSSINKNFPSFSKQCAKCVVIFSDFHASLKLYSNSVEFYAVLPAT